ncbi:MAG TPA: cupin domain-containing protein [Acidimicrobiales bacterium]|nr:cupin domain-containing protein [Acidimicrobiales bacterium]
MPKLQITELGSTPWMTAKAGYESGSRASNFEQANQDSDDRMCHRIHHPGSDTDLQMFEVRVPPGFVVESHAHDEDEIIFVLEGEMVLGARVLGAGSSAMIPGKTLYGFSAGADGLRFLNFRARRDVTFHTKEQFMTQRKGRQRA